jgi:hypothetical protein
MMRATRWKSLAGGASLAVIAAHLGAQGVMRADIARALPASAQAAAIDVDPWSGRIAIAGLSWSGPDGTRVSVGRATALGGLAFVGPARAADAVTLENVKVETGGASYVMKRIELTGATSTRDEVAALFDASSAAPLYERLARITAEQISIPELVTTGKMADQSSTVTYRDIRLVGVSKGAIKSMAASGGLFETRRTDDAVSGTVGPMAGVDIDAALVARIYGAKAEPGDTEMKLIYGGFTVDAVKGSSAKGGEFTIGRLAFKNVRGRPTQEAWLPFLTEFAGKGDVAKLPPQERARFVRGLTDILDAIAVESAEAVNLTVTSPASSKDKATVKVARLGYAGAAMGRPNDLRLEGLDVAAVDGYGRIGSISQTGWSFRTTLDALRATVGDPDADLSAIDPRAFIPDLGTFAIRDVDLNVPDKKARETDPAAPNIRVGFKTFEVAAQAPVKGVPTALRIGLDRMTMAIPPGTKEEGLRDLLAMGYKDLDVTMGLEGRWNENAAEFNIGQIALQGVNMGSLAVKGVLGNVSRDVFAGDSATAQVALLGATVKQVGFTLENKGLAEKLLEREARRQKKSVDQLRKELGGAAQIGIPAMLGGSPNAKALGAAVAKFLLKPGRLTVTATAHDPGGLGFADFAMAQGDPAALLDQIDLTARAE